MGGVVRCYLCAPPPRRFNARPKDSTGAIDAELVSSWVGVRNDKPLQTSFLNRFKLQKNDEIQISRRSASAYKDCRSPTPRAPRRFRHRADKQPHTGSGESPARPCGCEPCCLSARRRLKHIHIRHRDARGILRRGQPRKKCCCAADCCHHHHRRPSRAPASCPHP